MSLPTAKQRLNGFKQCPYRAASKSATRSQGAVNN